MSHAILERKEGRYTIKDMGSTNGMYIDGNVTRGPVDVTVGMEIYLGNVLLFGVNEEGCAPLRGYTIESCRRFAVFMYGTPSEAARRIKDGYSREYFRQAMTRERKEC